jgi:[acyl-carrier-protein] S-malonyltransferase
MGRSLWEEYPAAKRVYECGEDILGLGLRKISAEGSERELSRTAVCQPVIFAHSLAAFLAAVELLPLPDAVAGHSLGEYAALCCAGSCSLEDGFRVIGARAAVMEAAARTAPGAMVAATGDAERVVEICKKYKNVWAVNFNTKTQTVISGEEEACLKAAGELAQKGVRTTRLSVGSAFHTLLMQRAADELKERLKGIKFQSPKITFYSNLTGGRLSPADFPDYFASHMVSPVCFAQEIAAITADGITACVEFGPKRTAATLAKKNNRELEILNVEDADTLRAAVGGMAGSGRSRSGMNS